MKRCSILFAALATAISPASAEEVWEHYFTGIMNSGFMMPRTRPGMIVFKGRIILDQSTAFDAYAVNIAINGAHAKALCVADFPKFPMLATCEGDGAFKGVIDLRSWSAAQKMWF